MTLLSGLKQAVRKGLCRSVSVLVCACSAGCRLGAANSDLAVGPPVCVVFCAFSEKSISSFHFKSLLSRLTDWGECGASHCLSM